MSYYLVTVSPLVVIDDHPVKDELKEKEEFTHSLERVSREDNCF